VSGFGEAPPKHAWTHSREGGGLLVRGRQSSQCCGKARVVLTSHTRRYRWRWAARRQCCTAGGAEQAADKRDRELSIATIRGNRDAPCDAARGYDHRRAAAWDAKAGNCDRDRRV